MLSDMPVDKCYVLYFRHVHVFIHDYQEVQVASLYNCLIRKFFACNDAIGQEM